MALSEKSSVIPLRLKPRYQKTQVCWPLSFQMPYFREIQEANHFHFHQYESGRAECKGPWIFEEKTSHLLFGDHECQEFIFSVLHFINRGAPPPAGIMNSLLSGCRSMKLSAWQKTTHLPSGEYLAKKLLLLLPEAPSTGTANPPLSLIKRNPIYAEFKFLLLCCEFLNILQVQQYTFRFFNS